LSPTVNPGAMSSRTRATLPPPILGLSQ
jgi:hypothetical protein